MRFYIFTLLVLFISFQLKGQQDSSKIKKPKLERDKDITSFQQKQEDVLLLIEQQKAPLQKVLSNVKHHQQILAQWSELLRSPKKVEQYRHEARDSVYKIRKYADIEFNKLKDLHFKWFPYTKTLMAVYTRYGEMLVLEKVDENLKKFLLAFREHNDKVEKIMEMIQDIFNECDYLLDSKLH